MDDVNDCKAALLLIGEAFSRITRIEPVTLFTNIGYLVGLYTDERLKKWHDSRWMSRKGRQVMNAELLKTLYEKNIPVEEVRQDQHSYYEWMKNEAEKELKKWRDEKCSTDSENSAQPRK
jgi:ribonuclease HI